MERETDPQIEAEYFISSLSVMRQRDQLQQTDFFKEHEQRLQHAQDLFDRYGLTLEQIMGMNQEEYKTFLGTILPPSDNPL